MGSQFIDNFVHLECGWQGLDQHGRLEGARRNLQMRFGAGKHFVPQTRFEVTFHFRQVKSRRRAARDHRLGIVKHIQAKIEQPAGQALAIDGDVPLGQMPAARAHHQHRRARVELVGLAGNRVGIIQFARPIIFQIDLAFNHIGPDRRRCIFKIGHEHMRPAIEAVDNHLAIHRAGDFDAPVQQVVRQGGNGPGAVADVLGRGQEIGLLTSIEAFLTLHPGGEQLHAAGVKLAVQLTKESQRLRRQYLAKPGPDCPTDDDTIELCLGFAICHQYHSASSTNVQTAHLS